MLIQGARERTYVYAAGVESALSLSLSLSLSFPPTSPPPPLLPLQRGVSLLIRNDMGKECLDYGHKIPKKVCACVRASACVRAGEGAPMCGD